MERRTDRIYYDLPPTDFIWYRSDVGYSWKQEAIGLHWQVFQSSIGMLRMIEDLNVNKSERAAADIVIGNVLDNMMLGSIYHGPFLIEAPETTKMVATYPLIENTNLFLQFAQLDQTEEAILAFAKDHGYLTEDCVVLEVPSKTKHPSLKRLKKLADDPDYGDSFRRWKEEIQDMATVTKLHQWFRDGDKKSLSKVIKWEEGNSLVYFVGIGEESGVRTDLTERQTIYQAGDVGFELIKSGDVLLPALVFIVGFINEKLKSEVDLTVKLRQENARPVPFVQPSNLLSAMWVQFHGWVIGERDFKRCPLCGKYEDVTDKRPTWERHSECAAKKRAARSYENKKKREVAAKELAAKKSAKKPAVKKASRGGKK